LEAELNGAMKNLKFQKGFTLIELLVAMSLFVIFIAIASGGFIRALRTQRAIVALMAVNDNTSLVLEQMSREMRTGYNFCTNAGDPVDKRGNRNFPECASLSNDELAFITIKNQAVSYKWEDGAIKRKEFGVSEYKAITGENILVRNFKIKLMGNKGGDGYFPRITISVSVSPKSEISYLQNIFTNIQATISSRSLDS
jgi:prepilin-type N-terminal cleavage/methylation domain-containing protein